MHKPGDILTWDCQSDIFRGRYKLIAPVEGERNAWVIEHLPPDDDEVDRMINFYASNEAHGSGFLDTVEGLMKELGERPVGRRSTIRLVS